MAGHMRLKTWFDAAQQHVTLQIEEGEKKWAHVTLELPEFTDLMRGLARYRMQFAEQVPGSIDPGAKVEAIANPAWEVRSEVPGLPDRTALLHLRHPGYGWLSFAVPADEAREMGRALIRSAQASATRPR
jgi:hypothetical protein